MLNEEGGVEGGNGGVIHAHLPGTRWTQQYAAGPTMAVSVFKHPTKCVQQTKCVRLYRINHLQHLTKEILI